MVTEFLHIVGKVFPLIIDRGRRRCTLIYIITALRLISIERKWSGRTAGTRQTITEARSNHKILDRLEICIDGTIHIESTVAGYAIVTHHEWVELLTCIESRHTIVVTSRIGQEMLSACQGTSNMSRQVSTLVCNRGQWIHRKHSCHHRTILRTLWHRTSVIFFNLVSSTHLQPWLDLIFSIDGSGETTIEIIITSYHTIIVKISKRKIIVAILVTTRKAQVVLLHLTLAIDSIYPRGIGCSIPIFQEIILGKGLTFFHILDIFFGIEQLRLFSKRFDGILEIICYLSTTHRTLLRSNENHAITSLCTIYGSRSGILQHFHRCYVIRIDTTNIA